MNIEDLRAYCLNRKGVSESFPFGPETLVFKVMGKIFLLVDIDAFESFNVKCDPERAVALREQYSGIMPGYHMNKKHWNTILTDGTVPDALIKELIDHSYALVFAGLSKSVRDSI